MPELTEFHDVRFPTDISLGASGGPRRRTEIVTLGSGHEKRNQRWADSRRRFDAGYGVKSLVQLHDALAFYEARRGPLHSFRFRDPLDWKSCSLNEEPRATDQFLGLGDANTRQFPLRKRYGFDNTAYWRPIAKPVEGTLLVAVDGVSLLVGHDYNFDGQSKEIIFEEASIPANNAQVTAGFEFDVHVRFEADEFTYSIDAFNAGQIPNIPLMEVLS